MQDLTTGSVSRHLLKTMSFMLVSMVFQTLYVLVDLYWVGRLGTEAVAAVAISGNLLFVVLAVTQMLGVGTTTLISHAAGSKDRDRALLVFNQSQVLAMVVGVIFLVVAMALRPLYARRLSADAVTAQLVLDYLLWFIPAMGAAVWPRRHGVGAARHRPVQARAWSFKPARSSSTSCSRRSSSSAGASAMRSASPARRSRRSSPSSWARSGFSRTSSRARSCTSWSRIGSRGSGSGATCSRSGCRPARSSRLMAVYLGIVYYVTRPFGAAAQAGFGIGLRIVQSAFLPVVALGFAGGAGRGAELRRPPRRTRTPDVQDRGDYVDRRDARRHCHHALVPGPARFASSRPIPNVIAVGEVYLRIVSWNFIASGLVFVELEHVSGDGQHAAPARDVLRAHCAGRRFRSSYLAKMPGFKLEWIWWLSVARRHRADGVESAAAAAGVRRAAAIRANRSPR